MHVNQNIIISLLYHLLLLLYHIIIVFRNMLTHKKETFMIVYYCVPIHSFIPCTNAHIYINNNIIKVYKAVSYSLKNHKNNELHCVQHHTKLPNLHY